MLKTIGYITTIAILGFVFFSLYTLFFQDVKATPNNEIIALHPQSSEERHDLATAHAKASALKSAATQSSKPKQTIQAAEQGILEGK